MRLELKNLADRKAEILLYGEIGWENEAGSFARDLAALEADEITLRVHSPGGDVYEGLAMMNALQAHPARVTAVVEGLAASAASFIAVGGADRIVMRPHAEMMIHDAWTFCGGNAEDIGRVLEDLDRISGNLAEIYSGRAGTPADMWREAMRAETWFTADEAVSAGLADEVVSARDEREKEPVSAFTDSRIMAKCTGRRGSPPAALLNRDEAGEERTMSFFNSLAEKLGLEVGDADEELILTALDEALEERAEIVESENEGASERQAKAGDSASGADDDTVTLDKDTYERLLEEAEAGREAAEKAVQREAEELVAAAIEDGRLAAASRDRWVSKILADPEDAKPRLAALAPGRVPRAEIGHGGSQSEDFSESDELTNRAIAQGVLARPQI